jgi:hypothetical protein
VETAQLSQTAIIASARRGGVFPQRAVPRVGKGRSCPHIRSICTFNNLKAFIIPLNPRGMSYQVILLSVIAASQ